jgi:hypothetical protein
MLWVRVPNALSIRTDIVGYQIFNNFNSLRYNDAYYFIALLFPALAIVVYLVLAWLGPIKRHPSPDHRIFPLLGDDILDRAGHSAASMAPRPVLVTWFWAAARVGLPALAVAVEVSAGQARSLRIDTAGVSLAAAYAGSVVLVAALLREAASGGRGVHRQAHDLGTYVARVNSLAALVVVPLLYLVSQATSVTIDPGRRLVRYPWLPWWVVVAVTVVAAWAWRRGSVRARTPADVREHEAKMLTWVVGPVVLFLVVAWLPVAIGGFQAFDDAQFLAAPQLIFHQGLFPWRDVYALHGLLSDVFDGAVGMVAFGNTRWGGNAGLSMLVGPLNWLVVYGFAAYFCRRNRLLLVGLTVAVGTGLLEGNVPRFLLFPLFLVLLDQVLRRPTWGRCGLFVFALVAGTILTPEEALFVPCLLGVVFLFELASYRRGSGLRAGFRRTWRCVAVGVVLASGWGAFLGGMGALRSFVDFFVVFAQGHGLEGGYPTQWRLGINLVTVEWVLPTVLWLATLWRVVAKLRRRSAWAHRDWVIVAAALCSALYFPKALDRADYPHVLEVFSISVPLLVLWAVDLLDRGDRTARRWSHLPGLAGSLRLRQLATGGAVAAVLAGTVAGPITVSAALRSVPADLHRSLTRAQVPSEPMLGYTVPGSVDIGQIEALRSVLERYAGRTGPVFDYSNELGIVYYLLNRVPGTRHYYSAVVQTARAQRQEIADLAASRPPVVVFTNTTFGLVSYDGIPQSLRSFAVSEYLFAHYRPLLDVQGQLILLRDDLFATAPPVPAGLATAGLYFDTPPCNFGDIPNFFTVPASVEGLAGVPLASEEIISFTRTFSGWAVDQASGGAARQVLAAVNGVVVAMAPTGNPRPDVSAARHARSALNSGFSLSIPASAPGAVVLYALNGDGTVSPLERRPKVPASMIGTTPAGPVTTPDGRRHPLRQGTVTGVVEDVNREAIEVLRLHLPGGFAPGRYPWLRVDSASTLRSSTVTLTDDATAPPGHQIAFHMLERSGTHVMVGVGACLQWHGYGASRDITVVHSGADQPLTFSLVRQQG